MSNENDNKIENYKSITEAYEAGKKAGIIEGYLRASNNLKAVISKLQDKFLEKIGLADEMLDKRDI